VTAQVSTETPAAVTTLDREAVRELPGMHMDDRLRLVPGFSLFRRNSSLSANPTTQGVSLRGIGSTGASRTLVLWDGLPLNDPFGGWVYWNRVAPEELERTEVTRAAYTSVFGDRAMGGALGLFSREPTQRRFSAGWDFGNRGTQQVLASGAYTWSRFAVSSQFRAFTWDGYRLVPEPQRGRVDTDANSRFASGILRTDYLGSRDRLFVRTDFLAEERQNGTPLQNNSTGLGMVGGAYMRDFGSSALSLLGYHSRGQFHASFSSIAADRNSERLTSLQTVPSDSSGGAALWRGSKSRFSWIAGTDMVHVEGYSKERLFPAGARIGGGTQFQYGVFGQGDVKLGAVRLFGGLRYHDAGSSNRFWGPSGGAVLGTGRSRYRASAFRGFRAPTLNELYREFRQGNVVTQANPALAPETLNGLEAGYDFNGETFTASFTGFYNRLDGLITNVTLSQTPTLITRQRRNAGAALSRGVEADLHKRWGSQWEGVLSYLLADSRYEAGARVPQVARHQGTAQLMWRRNSTLLTGGLRTNSLAFEDDLNRFVMPGFVIWHAIASQGLGRGVSVHFALENAFDRQYLSGVSPAPLLAAPRLIRGGVRYQFQ